VLNLSQAAKYCGVSNKTIERLVADGLIPMQQVVPKAPWEIQRSDLDSQKVRRILDRLRRTGKLLLGLLRCPLPRSGPGRDY
jgi:excisionase family DNA binding protein